MKIDPVAKIFIMMGIGSIAFGLLWQSGLIESIRLGRLPGDIVIEKENYRFYFPIITSLILSALLSFIMWLLRR